MGFAEVRRTLLRDFVLSVEQGKVPPLSGYLPDYVKSGFSVVPEDFRLLPLTPPALRFVNSSSHCVTDCLLDLQSKYQQFVPDDWGGHQEKGSRDLAVIGFNIREGLVLDILEIDKTTSFVDWAEPKLNSLDWERLLIHAVVDFGRYCQAQAVRLQPAHCYPAGTDVAADPTKLAEVQAELKQRYDGSARASGFVYDQGADCFVLDLRAK
jgi:hypothetical protein